MADIELRLNEDVLVVQGALGTVFEAQGFGDADDDPCFPFLNLTEPETVEELHRRYLAAGADCAVTNTFMATSSRLAPHGLLAQTQAINEAGVRLASGLGFQHVLAAIGPCGVAVEPGSGVAALRAERARADESCTAQPPAPGYAAAFAQYEEQAAALASAGPDALMLETFTDLDDALAAVAACRKACDAPVFACMAFSDGADGPAPADAARALVEAGAAAVGCNCMGVDETVAAIEQMAAAVDVALIARPNAGVLVRAKDGTLRWPLGPDDFADAALRLVRAGASIVGSCCGSTPACTGAVFAAVGGMHLPAAR